MCCIQIAYKNGTLRCVVLKVAHRNMLKIAHHFSLCTSVNFEQALVTCGERVLLQTATVPIQTADGSETISFKVLLDSASHRTFMTDRVAVKFTKKGITFYINICC